MTRRQALKKCEIARDKGIAYLSDGDFITFYDDTKEYSLRSGWRGQTICVTYKVDKIIDLIID
jgi:hypothetical protein